MIERGWGRIVNISSTASVVAIPQLAHYCTSKAGLAMLTKGLAVELGPHGITVNGVGPSTVKTRLNEEVLARGDMELREAELNPTRRLGTPPISPRPWPSWRGTRPSWINGQNIVVDGGLTALSPQPAYEMGSR